MIKEWADFARNGHASWDSYKNQGLKIFTNGNSYGYELTETSEKRNLLRKLLEMRMNTVYRSF